MAPVGRIAAPAARNFAELRPVGIDLGVSASASGSSYVTVGETKVKCCVNAPRPCNKRILHETGLLSVEVRFSGGVRARPLEFDLESVLCELFERHVLLRRYPHQLIECWLSVEEDDGGLFAACVMGLCLAFADCGVHMVDVVAAASVVRCSPANLLGEIPPQFAFRDSGGTLQLALDLSAEEEAYYEAQDPNMTRVHLAYCPHLNVVAYLLCTGVAAAAVMEKMLAMAQAACDVISVEVESSLKGHVEWKSERPPICLDGSSICPEIEL